MSSRHKLALAVASVVMLMAAAVRAESLFLVSDPSIDTARFAGDWTITRSLHRIETTSVVGSAWEMSYRDDNVDVSQSIHTAGLRRDLASGLWAQGGLGIAQGAIEFDPATGRVDRQSDPVPAASIGIGFGLVDDDRLRLELAASAAAGVVADEMSIYNVVVGFGGSWR